MIPTPAEQTARSHWMANLPSWLAPDPRQKPYLQNKVGGF